ncbi:MAG: Unknown protein [uncultured Sulfurovum sp.]|uniref:TonB-dependent receptor n=1 Tax=uncultured Sulfurovum sp. TaxID=269237 RepID=A0A6S6U6T6_9BACT|nr:MAG: Unknown protein [uncultured Sulfurovum sp.]
MNPTIKLSLITSILLTSTLFAENNLDDITITSATKTSQKLSDITSNVNVITAQEIEERHYTTVTEALNSLPGISFNANGGAGQVSSIRLRGMDNKNLLVIIDGIRYNDISNSSGAIFSQLMVNDIEQIEVLKGAQSGIWGADAAAGVINIRTKMAKEGLQFHIQQELGSFNSSTTDIGTSYKNKKFYLKASQSRSQQSGFSAQATNGEELNDFEDDGYQNTSSHLKVGFYINATNKIDLSHTIIDSTTEIDNTSPNEIVSNSTNESQLSKINFNHIDSFNELNIYASKSKFDRKVPSYGQTYLGEIKEYGLNSKIAYLTDSFILLGGDYKKFEDKSPSINNGYTNQALFLTNNNKVSNSLGTSILTQSIRHDKYNKFDNETTGKIGFKHTFIPNEISIGSNYGTAYNVPTLYSLFNPGYTYLGVFNPVGNANLKPEKTKSLDVTIAYKDFSATYFNTKIDDLTEFVYGTGYSTVLGTSKIKGYELSYNSTFFDIVALSLGYTKLNAKDKDDNDLQRRANESLKFGIDYYGIDKLHIGLNGEYIGDRKDRIYNPITFSTTDVKSGNYSVANLTMNYEVDKHLNFYGKINNLTDKYYQTAYNYASSPRAFYTGMKLTY